ncbi:MAG: hypothetical protein MRK02_11370 [Candidatus Scalindua sp.]|nr:hypothetical protein [Candidatus Scalindua sp.]
MTAIGNITNSGIAVIIKERGCFAIQIRKPHKTQRSQRKKEEDLRFGRYELRFQPALVRLALQSGPGICDLRTNGLKVS